MKYLRCFRPDFSKSKTKMFLQLFSTRFWKKNTMPSLKILRYLTGKKRSRLTRWIFELFWPPKRPIYKEKSNFFWFIRSRGCQSTIYQNFRFLRFFLDFWGFFFSDAGKTKSKIEFSGKTAVFGKKRWGPFLLGKRLRIDCRFFRFEKTILSFSGSGFGAFWPPSGGNFEMKISVINRARKNESNMTGFIFLRFFFPWNLVSMSEWVRNL